MTADMDQVGVSGAPLFSPMDIDAIGEVLNISMGSAATAVSSMLDKQVVITTPKVEVAQMGSIDSRSLEPAIIVKIVYTEGLTGSNCMAFRQSDMQLILNGLMGIDEPPSNDFVFDELSMSAACEVMNQMMGASATALADFLGMSVNISTPTAVVMDDEHTFIDAVGISPDESVVSVLFNMSIKDIMNSEFVSILPIDFAKMLVSSVTGEAQAAAPQMPAAAAPQMPAAAAPQMPAASPAMPAAAPAMPAAAPQMPAAMPQMPAAMPQMPDMSAQMPAMPMGMGQAMPGMMPGMIDPAAMQQGYYPPPYPQMPPQGYPMYPPYGGYPPYPQEMMGAVGAHPVKNVQFPEFAPRAGNGDAVMGGNMDLIMNVPLDVSIEIGATRRKIKDIMGFTQGTVIELEKQAGAPVDIVVNGQLIAHGDVVVIDDNFGVRITEIIGTKELLNALGEKVK